MTTMIATCSVEKKYMDVRKSTYIVLPVFYDCALILIPHHRRLSPRVGLPREWHWLRMKPSSMKNSILNWCVLLFSLSLPLSPPFLSLSTI